MAYPYDMYAEILKKELGKKYLDREESNYLLNFADSSIMSSSKKIYYHALFYYKRFYPRILIHLIIKNKVKKALKNQDAPHTIQNLYKQIAKIICLSVMGAYGKGKKINILFDISAVFAYNFKKDFRRI